MHNALTLCKTLFPTLYKHCKYNPLYEKLINMYDLCIFILMLIYKNIYKITKTLNKSRIDACPSILIVDNFN